MTSEENPPYADDEIKTYVDEGDEKDEIKKSENLSEDKKQLVGDSDEENGNSAVKDGSTENPFLPTGPDAFHFQQLYSSFLYPGLHLARFPYMYSKDKLPLPPAMAMGYPPGFAPLPPSAHPGLFPFYSPEMCRWFPAFPGSLPRSPLLPGSPAPPFMPISCLTSPSSHNSPKIPSHMMENCDASMRGSLFNPHNGLLTTEPHFFQNTSFNQQKASPKKPTIKKPLNAFMLFMKEMRPSVIAENHLKESAAINQILGRKWHEIGRKEQQKYYDMAKKEKELHAQKHPGWSARDNYAMNSKKKKKHKLEHMDGNVSSGSESSRVNRMKNVQKPCKSLDILMSDSAST